MMRYQNLMVGDGLSDHHRYTYACNELISMIDLGYSRLPKDVKAFIFQDCLSAFRLLPEMNTTAAVSAANLLVKSVKSAFPKQKKNLAIVQFKQALKRRTKSHEENIDTPSLPQDVLVHIFSLLDVSSLISSSQVSRSWNLATHEGSLWRSLFNLHFSHDVLTHIHPGFDWREAFKQGRLKENVVNYLLGITSSSDESNLDETDSVESGSVESDSVESDSDDEDVPGLWANPKKHTERIPTL
uniref:F-box domain-containing protein n=2 Tax=Brassica oleracea TaxID=3712 RepID=A0A0D3EAH0_BRAOL|nr:unnamed protein product [Brassica oleracea]